MNLRLRGRTPYPIGDMHPEIRNSGAVLLCDPEQGGWRLGVWRAGNWHASDTGEFLHPSHFAVAPGLTHALPFWPQTNLSRALWLLAAGAIFAGLFGLALTAQEGALIRVLCGPSLGGS